MPPELARIVVGVILTVATFTDLRNRRVPLWLTLGGSAAGLVFAAMAGGSVFRTNLLGLVVGLLVLAPFVLGGGFGGADALLLGTIGAWLGWTLVLWTAWWAAVAGAGLALIARGRGQKTFPYVPALAVGLVIALLTVA